MFRGQLLDRLNDIIDSMAKELLIQLNPKGMPYLAKVIPIKLLKQIVEVRKTSHLPNATSAKILSKYHEHHNKEGNNFFH